MSLHRHHSRYVSLSLRQLDESAKPTLASADPAELDWLSRLMRGWLVLRQRVALLEVTLPHSKIYHRRLPRCRGASAMHSHLLSCSTEALLCALMATQSARLPHRIGEAIRARSWLAELSDTSES
jgi:hypothetical protein